MSLLYVVVDGCPVPRLLARRVRALKKVVPSAKLNSCYRGEGARRLLHKNGKHTQAELYRLHQRDPAHYAPANPPGFSTHELFSDGVAYNVRRGRKLKWWQCGMDFDDWAIPALKKAAAHRGWKLVQPYSAGSEYHHVNFAALPKMR